MLLAKAVWLMAVIVAIAAYIGANLDQARAAWLTLSPLRVAISVALFLLAKLLLAEVARQSSRALSVDFGFWQAFRFCSISQLGKYLPGGIWHFVGRIAMYRNSGIAVRTGSAAVLLENLWLVTSTLFIGVICLWPRLLAMAGGPDFTGRPALVFLAAALIAPLWLVAVMAIGARLTSPSAASTAFHIRVLATQALIWIALGLCFWVLLPAVSGMEATVTWVIGAFAIAWLAGYLAPFAPAGVGVREAALALLLAGALTLEHAIVYAAVNRVIWTVGELGLGVTWMVAGRRYEQRLSSPAAREVSPVVIGDRPAAREL